MTGSTTVLVHSQYASPYYDPVKAHEYYEEHKKLKGNTRRASTASLNETGKKAALYVKKNLDEEHKTKSDQLKADTESKFETAKNQTMDEIKSNTQALKSNIEALKVKMKKMNPAQKKQAEIRIKAEIERMRKANDENRKALLEKYKETAKGISEEHSKAAKALSTEYNNRYADEVDRMNKDPNMIKGKSSRSGSKSGGGYTFVYRRGQKQDSGKKESYTFKNRK